MPRPSAKAVLGLLLLISSSLIDEGTGQVNIETVPDTDGYSVPVSYVPSVNRQSTDSVCKTWNHNNYRTFDGKLYKHDSRCTYIFAKDCLHNTFSIYTTNLECTHGKCGTRIEVYLGMELSVIMETRNNTALVINGETSEIVSIPAIVNDVVVERIAHYIFMESRRLGIKMQWDGEDYIQLEVDPALRDSTCGLCGVYDGNPANDFMTMNNELATHVSTFTDAYKKIDLVGGVCQEYSNYAADTGCGDRTNLFQEAYQLCQVIEDEFPKCRAKLGSDAAKFMTLCTNDYCSGGRPKACKTLQTYFEECSSNNGPRSYWRKKDRCELTCGGGEVFNPCGKSCEATCGDPNVQCVSNKCVDACFCQENYVKKNGRCIKAQECPCKHGDQEYPVGGFYMKDCNKCTCQGGKWSCERNKCNAVCSSTGDPHYRTFDGKKFDFHGNCTYALVQGPRYSIAGKNVKCGRGGGACTDSITIYYHQHTIQLQQGKTVLVDGIQVTVPHYLPQITVTVTKASSMFIQVKLANGAKVLWDGKTRAYITVPQSQFNQVKGLCGTFTSSPNDDFTTKSGGVEANPNIFGNEWKLDKQCADVPADHVVDAPCKDFPDRKVVATTECGKLRSPIFKACHNFEDPLWYFENCEYDVCECQTNLKECMCDAFAAYAADCAKHGIIVPWRQQIPACGIQCPPGQVYKTCGSACNATCATIANDPDCVESCVEGCACPDGQTLDDNDRCVPMKQCPCKFDGRDIASGVTLSKGSQDCTCDQGRFRCITPKVGDVRVKVTPSCTGGRDYTECKTNCPATCEDPFGPTGCQENTAETCRPGCQCPKGTVWDGKTCIAPFTCPCHYRGKAYQQGEVVKQACKQCICKNQQWDCDKDRVCPSTCTAHGESHYKTFDGKEFQFQGECDYTLLRTKSTATGVPKFDITVSNVPCGSSGVTCTKSIDLSIGDPFAAGAKFHQLHLVRGKPIQVPAGSPFSVRKAGLFVIIENANIGMTVYWDKGTRIYVTLQEKLSKKVEGLCGNFNGDQNDDFTTPTNSVEQNPRIFADSWAVNKHCPPSKNIPEPCEKAPHRKQWAQHKCNIIKSKLFESCHSAVPPKAYYDRCYYDACACDYGGDCECLCTAIASYAQDCAAAGVVVKWRDEKTCPLQCADCDSYSPCMSGCPKKTCDNKAVYDQYFSGCEKQMCVEGCSTKPCSPGQVYLNDTVPYKCVEMDDCPNKECRVQGEVFPPYKVIKDENFCSPCENCWCEDGIIKKVKIPGAVCVTTPAPTPPIFTFPKFPTFPTVKTPFTTPDADVTTPPIDCLGTGWTGWMDGSIPNVINGGEFETRISHRKKYSFCRDDEITDIQCREEGDNKLVPNGNQMVTCSLPEGLVCKDSDNAGQPGCKNYVVRYWCQCGGDSGSPTNYEHDLNNSDERGKWNKIVKLVNNNKST